MPSWKHREHSIKIQTVLQDRGFPQGSWEFMKAGWGFPLNGGYFWSCCVVCTRPILSGCSAPKRSTPSPRVLLGGHWNNKHPPVVHRLPPTELCHFQNHPARLVALVHVLPGFSGDRGWKLVSWSTLGWTEWVHEKKRKKNSHWAAVCQFSRPFPK